MTSALGPLLRTVAILAELTSLSACLMCQQASMPVLRAVANPSPTADLSGREPQKEASPSSSLKVPLEFESNRGQAPAEYPFVAHGPTYSLGLSPADIALSLHRSRTGSAPFDSGAPEAMDHS